jgi:hypothetical protein
MNRTSGWFVAAVVGVLLAIAGLWGHRSTRAGALVFVPEQELGPSVSLGVEIRRQLHRHGSNLQLPHDLDFYFYLPTHGAAQNAARDLRARGFSVAVSRSASGAQWLCLANRRIVPDRRRLDEWGPWFQRVAAAHGGEYDGWEGSIERK